VPTSPTPGLLALWDIDHTLIETRGVGNEMYRAAFETITGQPLRHTAAITGRTERAILAETLRLHGLEPSEAYHARYAEALAQLYEEHAALLRQRGRALPGAKQALAAVAGLSGVAQTVLSGNLRAVAITKLRAFDLERYVDFDIGAYGDDETDRPKLVTVCQRRGEAKHGTTFARHNTVIVGDSLSDVETGVMGGAVVIGVASGKSSAAELRAAGAETVLADLSDAQQVVGVLRRMLARGG
jgi:phosphoglycolate phosphatase